MSKSFETLKPETTHDYQSVLDTILNRELSVESIDSYAEGALNDLIELTEAVKQGFLGITQEVFDNERDKETAAFEHFELRDIEPILDYVSEKADEIKRIDLLISNIPTKATTFVPADDPSRRIESNGSGSFREKAIYPRLKTILFLLVNEFSIKIDEPDELTISKGLLADNGMRGESYAILEVKKLERTILVCDEEGNVTYILDTKKLIESGINPQDLTDLTKKDITAFLNEKPELGRRIVYSQDFVSKVVRNITEIEVVDSNQEVGAQPESVSYLIPKKPEGYVAHTFLAHSINVAPSTVDTAVKQLADVLGDIVTYRYGTKISRAYSPQQQEMIKTFLDNSAPDGYLPYSALSKELGISRVTLVSRVGEIISDIGEVRAYMFGSSKKEAIGFSAEQQEVIRNYIEKKGYFKHEIPEEYQTVHAVASSVGVGSNMVKSVIAELGDSLGSVEEYRVGTSRSLRPAYSPFQQKQIIDSLANKGIFEPKMLKDHKSLSILAKSLGVTLATVSQTAEKLKDELGYTATFRNKVGKTVEGLSPDQQGIIVKDLEERGLFTEHITEEYLNVAGIARSLEVSDRTVSKAIVELRDELGVVDRKKVGTVARDVYNEEQQQKIRKALEQKGLLTQLAPEGYISIRGISRLLSKNAKTVERAIDEIKGGLGEAKIYKFGGKTALGYSPEQKEQILLHLKKRGVIT